MFTINSSCFVNYYIKKLVLFLYVLNRLNKQFFDLFCYKQLDLIFNLKLKKLFLFSKGSKNSLSEILFNMYVLFFRELLT